MFIDFLYRFVIDHITCYYFRLMAYSSEESILVRPRVKIANRNPWYDKMINRGSYRSIHVLLNLLNELWKRENVRLAKHFITFSQRV